MDARAVTHGGVSVVNALPTGRGASLAVDLPLEAEVHLRDDPVRIDVRVEDLPEADPAPVRGAVDRVLAAHGLAGKLGAEVTTRSEVPEARGLKSSSAATGAAALAADAASARAREVDPLGVDACLEAAVDASLAAGVTVTGAWDDANATVRGGVCVTDNRERELLARYQVPDDRRVVLAIPPRRVPTGDAADVPHASVARAARVAHELALDERWADAMTVNGLALGPLYGLDPVPQLAALEAGADAVSVSGTGPAVAAVAPVDRVDAVRDALDALPGHVQVQAPWNDPAEGVA